MPSDQSPTVPLLVDRREAARLLGVSPGSVENLRTRGEIPSLKIGARRLFPVAGLRDFVAARSAAPPPDPGKRAPELGGGGGTANTANFTQVKRGGE